MEKAKYEKPSMIKIGHPLYMKGGMTNKGYHFIRSEIEGVSVAELVKSFGSPLFVFSEKKLREKFQEAKKAFTSKYPKVTFSWSYKTNYLKGICAIFHQEGALAEVVSEMEYEKARHLGIEGKDIIYNGPVKTEQSLKTAIKEGARIHVDTFDELRTIEELSKALGKKALVGIRINLNAGIYPQWSRFGLNLESGQAMDAIKHACNSDSISLAGLHTHLGTFIVDSNAYALAAQKMARLLNDIEEIFGKRLEYIDMGGGFASQNYLKGVYQSPEIAVPSIKEYADKIIGALKKELKEDYRPELVLESGRYMVDEAGFLVTSVCAQKLMADGRRSYVLDAGVNLLYTTTWYQLKVELDGAEEGLAAPSVLNGPLCMNIDVVHDGLMLPRLANGKRIVLSPVGAYNVTQWMQFIQYRPAVVLIGKDRKVHLLRKREDLEYLEKYEALPSFLELKKTGKAA